MSLSEFYLSFKGRVSRSDFWLKYWLPFLGAGIVLTLIDLFLGTFNEDIGIGLLSGIFSLLALWTSIAISVKRLQDRNRSGWFILLSFVPLVNIWIAIEMYFLRGTDGENWYGPDPVSISISAR